MFLLAFSSSLPPTKSHFLPSRYNAPVSSRRVPPSSNLFTLSADTPSSSPSPSQFQSVIDQLAASKSVSASPSASDPNRAPASQQSSDYLEKTDNFLFHEDSSWTTDQRAVYSILAESHYLQNDTSLPTSQSSLPASSPLHSDLLPTTPPGPPDLSETTARNHQSDPRLPDATFLSTTLSTIRRRRAQLAAETAEDTIPPVLFSSNPAEAPVIPPTDSPIAAILANLQRQNASTLLPDSLRAAMLLPPALLHNPPSQLIASLHPHLLHASRPPLLRRPFLALHQAVHLALHPPCVRCAAPTHPSVAERCDGLCDDCHAQIFLRDPFSTKPEATPDIAPWDREQATADEHRLTNDAVAVAHALRSPFLASAGSTASASTPATTSAVPTSSKASGGVNGNASGGASGAAPIPGMISETEDGWNVPASDRSIRTINPIRNLVQGINVQPNPDKELIKLSVGDPTVYGNLVVSERVTEHMCSLLRSGTVNGYTLSMGVADARDAVAERYSCDSARLTRDDVFLTSGASGALELALGVLANEGDNVLLPRPGFPLFRTLAENFGIECRYYNLMADDGWRAELSDIPGLCDERTRAILVNNPSNPCGSVWSREHIEEILAVAAEMRLPILSDEVYADMVFEGSSFHSFGSVSEDVPVLSVGAVSKQLVVPGWRLGWLQVHDRGDVLLRGGVRQGLRQLTTRMLVPNTVAQMGVGEMLKDQEGFQKIMYELEENAKFAMGRLREVDGLKCLRPEGAMYMMVEVDVKRMGLQDDMDFVERLLEEESVFVLPGRCFEMPNFVRIVFAAPKEVLSEAMIRIGSFCERKMNAM